MARAARSETEKLRGGMRAAALMRTLASRVGAENPHQFAEYFDHRTDMATQSSGKWRLNFCGGKPLSPQQLQLLSRIDADAGRLHNSGPADLWLAMWGDMRELWVLCRTRLTPYGPELDDQTWAAVRSEFTREQRFGETLAEFEGEVLLAEAYGEPLTLRHLTEAIVLHRLHASINAAVPLGIDGEGLSRCIRLCLEDDEVTGELQRLGVLDGVRRELAALIAGSAAAIPAVQRWDALSAKLDWIS